MVKKKEAPKLARNITNGMATWGFILGFFFLFCCWASWNTFTPMKFHFDRYPFILFNLMLSFIAAIQGSVIMIYQKYQDAERDAILRRLDKHDKAIMKELKHEETH